MGMKKELMMSYKDCPLSLIMVEYMRPVARVRVSKMARATKSLLKLLRRWLCMRTMLRMMLPTIPRTETTSLTRGIHESNSWSSRAACLSPLAHPVVLFILT